jgi:ABC-type branched-subunit amino acid transport system substrate-binding protein
MRGIIKISFLFLVVVNIYGQAVFQYDQQAEEKFGTAIKYFQEKKYSQAKPIFDNLITDNLHQRTTASYLMLAKTCWHINDYKKGIEILGEFFDKFEGSNYIDDAHYTQGLNFIGSEDYNRAYIEFVRALQTTNNSVMIRRSISHLDMLTKKFMSLDGLNSVFKIIDNQDGKNLVRIHIAQKYYYLGDVRKARAMLEPLVRTNASPKYIEKANSVWRIITEGVLIKIGALLPLMQNDVNSSYKEIGKDILRGIEVGVDEFNKKSEPIFKVEVDIKDTEKDPHKAAIELNNLAKDEEILAVVGPVFSNEAQSCAGVSQNSKIPFVSPTANGSGITDVSEYAFQANPDFINRGKAMAIYAIKELGLENLAVISPDESTSRSIVESFISEVENLGGKIIDVAWYQKGTTDLSEQFRKLRSIGLTQLAEPIISFDSKLTKKEKSKILRAGANPRLLDSLIEIGGSIGVNRIFGKRGKQVADSLRLRYTMPIVQVDSMNIPVNTIDGIFLPIYSAEEIGILTSQIYFHNLRTQILGTSEWYDEIELDQHAVYTDGIIFLSEIFINNTAPQVIEFLRLYSEKFKAVPTRYSFFGYDVVSVILSQIKSGEISRDAIAKRLSLIKSYVGLHSKISLNNRRVNSELNILKYVNGSIQKIGEINVNNY